MDLRVFGLGQDEREFLDLLNAHPFLAEREFRFYFDYIKDYPVDKKFTNILILREPKVVLPRQYSLRIMKHFDFIISMGRKRATNLGIESAVPFPYNRPRKSFYQPTGTRINSVVIINSNKFSSVEESNYGLRRLAIEKFYNSSLGISLYGPNWRLNKFMEFRKRVYSLRDTLLAGMKPSMNESFSGFGKRFDSWQGEVDDKILTLSHYKFSLVIENQSDYVSEKLLDSIFAGCIPIYVGPFFEGEYEDLETAVIRISKEDLRYNGIDNIISTSNLDNIVTKISILQRDEKFWLSLERKRVFSSILELTARKHFSVG